jgi:hypothetical protein
MNGSTRRLSDDTPVTAELRQVFKEFRDPEGDRTLNWNIERPCLPTLFTHWSLRIAALEREKR